MKKEINMNFTVKITKTITQEKEVPLRFFEIGDNYYREVVAAPDMLTAIKVAAKPTTDNYTEYLDHCGEELSIKEISLKQLEKTKVFDDDGYKKVLATTIVKRELEQGNKAFIIYTVGD
jgi:hypothetical protein